MNKREKGNYFEELACRHLEENGAQILFRNYRCRSGEIDIIAKDGRYISFIEVKYRTGTKFGVAEAAVDLRKQKTICRVSDFFRKQYKLTADTAQRFEVVAMMQVGDGIVHIKWHKNAFTYIPLKKAFY